MATSGSARQAALTAYRRFLHGEIGPLVEILTPDVEWGESSRSKLSPPLRGRNEIAGLLNAGTSKSPAILLRGLSITPSSITAEFAEPWWGTRGRWRRWSDSALGANYTQTLTLTRGGRIERITCSRRLPMHTADPSDQRLLLNLLLMR